MHTIYFFLASAASTLVSGSAVMERSASSLAVPSTLPGSWKYQGCYNEVPGRILKNGGYSSAENMTAEACINFCSSKKLIYAGLEAGSQCFCGSSLPSTATILTSNTSICSLPCTGDATQPCGGLNLLTIFWSGQVEPITNPGSGAWDFVACYTEGKTGRVLPHGVAVPGGSANMTVANCCGVCQANGWTLAGVEFSQECWCGKDNPTNGGTLAPSTPDGLSGCSSPCAGNISEYCGGSGRVNVYNLNNTLTTSPPPIAGAPATKPVVGTFTYVGCQSEGNGTRALTGNFKATDTMTLEQCAERCEKFAFMGVEYGRECYCGNALAPSSSKVADSVCKFVCPGATDEFCGAGGHLSLYQKI